LLPGEVNVGAIGKDCGDLCKTVSGKRPRGFQPRRAGQCSFQCDGELFFDFDRRKRRCGRIDLHLDVGHIRNGINRELGQRPESRSSNHQGDKQDEPPAPYRKIDDPLDHRSVLIAWLG
jgi:hypothetical protein